MPERVDLRRIFRSPASVLLAGALAVSGCSSVAKASEPEPKCPTTSVEVSLLVGGDPSNWNPIEGMKGSWRFTSKVAEVLNSARIGRVDTKAEGRITSLFTQRTTEAWYVCIKDVGATEPTAQNPQ